MSTCSEHVLSERSTTSASVLQFSLVSHCQPFTTNTFTEFTEIEGGTESTAHDESEVDHTDVEPDSQRPRLSGIDLYEELETSPEERYDGRVFLERRMPGECLKRSAPTQTNPDAYMLIYISYDR